MFEKLKVNPQDLRNHLDFMSSFVRRTGSRENRICMDYIEDNMSKADFSIYEMEINEYGGFGGSNIICQKNNDPDKPLFIIAAHHDHPWGPGANDNASGCAVLMEAAKRIDPKKLHVNLQFNFYDREETGFVGSRIHAEHLFREKKKIVGMYAIDMVGFVDRTPGAQRLPGNLKHLPESLIGDYVCISCSDSAFGVSKELFSGMKTIDDLKVRLFKANDPNDSDAAFHIADHQNFHSFGFPSGVITDTGFFRYRHWHKETDTPEKLDYEFMSKITESLVKGIYAVNKPKNAKVSFENLANFLSEKTVDKDEIVE